MTRAWHTIFAFWSWPKCEWLEAPWAQQQFGQQSDKMERVSKAVQDEGGSLPSVDSLLRMKLKGQDDDMWHLKSGRGKGGVSGSVS